MKIKDGLIICKASELKDGDAFIFDFGYYIKVNGSRCIYDSDNYMCAVNLRNGHMDLLELNSDIIKISSEVVFR